MVGESSDPGISVVPTPEGDIKVCFGENCVRVRCDCPPTTAKDGEPITRTNPGKMIPFRDASDSPVIEKYLHDTSPDEPVVVGVPSEATVHLDELEVILDHAQGAGRSVELRAISDG